MGWNYGHRRGRLEQLRVRSNIVAGAIGETNIRFEHVDDITEVSRVANRALDVVDRRLRDLA